MICHHGPTGRGVCKIETIVIMVIVNMGMRCDVKDSIVKFVLI